MTVILCVQFVMTVTLVCIWVSFIEIGPNRHVYSHEGIELIWGLVEAWYVRVATVMVASGNKSIRYCYTITQFRPTKSTLFKLML
jgi:hypothetical protein